MNLRKQAQRAPQKLLLAAALLPWLPLNGQTITNPSFEANNFGTFPGYVSGAANGPITGWTASDPARAGLNPAAGSPFANNGAIPDGTKVAFIQNNPAGTSSLSTTITDLVVGEKYNISFRANARFQGAANRPFLRIQTDGDGPVVNADISNVSGAVDATPYRYVGYEFTATATSHVLTLTNLRTDGDHTLVLDDFKIAESSERWSFGPWTGDGDSGIDSQYIYTHAMNFASNTSPVINGVQFLGRDTGAEGRFALSGLGGTAGRATNVTGDSALMANEFRFDGATGITLQNLKPNTEYLFTVYAYGWDDATSGTPYRTSTFQSNLSSERLTVNANHYGTNNGIRVNYRYTTDSAGSPVVISYPSLSNLSFHTSGFTNRETSPAVAPVVWTTEPWTDDTTSGVDGGFTYTHALNFGRAGTVNVNGVNFTGIAGGNPAGTNYTSTLPAVFNNDTNTVTGTSSGIAGDFVYGYPEVHNLSGLTPGKEYVFTIYSVGWEAQGGRINGFRGGAGEALTVLDQDAYGNDQGIRFVYRYTADASGTLKVTTSALNASTTIHVYGISNREAAPLENVAPTITSEPGNVVAGVGSQVTLRVGAVGSGPLEYTWRKGTTIVSTEGPVLEFFEVGLSDAGTYTVTVSNGSGQDVSEEFSLTVLDYIPGASNTGIGPDGFALMGGAIDPNFTLVQNPNDAASETVFVQTGLPGAWIANSGSSAWVGPLVNTVAAAPGDYIFRTEVDLTTFELATVSISGRWSSDNSGISILVNGEATGIEHLGATTYATLVPFTINLQNAPGLLRGVNTIDFVVRNDAVGFVGLRVDGLVAVGSIPPNTPPHIAVQPRSIAAAHNSVTTLGVKASGSGELSYQWFKGDDELDGETNPTLELFATDTSVAGDYKVAVTGTTTVESEVATVTVTNQNPVAADSNFTVANNSQLRIEFFDLAPNLSDPDGDIVELSSVATASVNGGTITEDDGAYVYTPAPGFVGLDFFTYTVNDGIWGGTATGNIYIEVTAGVVSGEPGPLALTMSGGALTGSFTGTPGASYTLQRSTTLEIGSWTDIGNMIAPENGAVSISDPAPPAGRAFYRISYSE